VQALSWSQLALHVNDSFVLSYEDGWVEGDAADGRSSGGPTAIAFFAAERQSSPYMWSLWSARHGGVLEVLGQALPWHVVG
jgi:hypothetical protein